MKDLLNLFNQQRQPLDFDGIKIQLASPDLVRSWSQATISWVRVPSPAQMTRFVWRVFPFLAA